MKRIILILIMMVTTSLAEIDQITILRNCTNEQLVVAATIWSEARGESAYSQTAVASVLKWRYDHQYFGATNYLEVCTASKQFSGWNGGDIVIKQQNAYDMMVWRFCLYLASKLIYEAESFNSVIEASHFVRADIKQPDWTKKLRFIRKIGAHNYYLINPRE